MGNDYAIPADCSCRKFFLWLNEPFAIVRDNAEALAQTVKLCLRTIATVGLFIATQAEAVIRFKACITEAERILDFLLFFSGVRDLLLEDGYKSPAAWFFGGACVGGAISFLHELTLVDLGVAAYDACNTITTGLAALGFLALGIEQAMKINSVCLLVGRSHKNYLQIAKTVTSFVCSIFYGSLTVGFVPNYVYLPLGVLAAGCSLGCVLYEEIAKKAKLI